MTFTISPILILTVLVIIALLSIRSVRFSLVRCILIALALIVALACSVSEWIDSHWGRRP